MAKAYGGRRTPPTGSIGSGCLPRCRRRDPPDPATLFCLLIWVIEQSSVGGWRVATGGTEAAQRAVTSMAGGGRWQPDPLDPVAFLVADDMIHQIRLSSSSPATGSAKPRDPRLLPHLGHRAVQHRLCPRWVGFGAVAVSAAILGVCVLDKLLWSFCSAQVEDGDKRAFHFVQPIPGAPKNLEYRTDETFKEVGLANSMINLLWD